MFRNLRLGIITSAVVILAMLIMSAWAWGQIPDAARLPVHWGLSGEVDGYGGKAEALLAVPVITLLLSTLLAFLPSAEPRRTHLEQSSGAYVTVWNAVVVVMFAIHAAIIATALGYPVNVPAVITGGVGLMFVVLGRVLGSVRSNFIFGVRTPWTLTSERSWEKTHQLAGRLFMLLGALVAVLALFGNAMLLFAVLFGGGMVSMLTTVIYSYVVWRNDPERQQAAP